MHLVCKVADSVSKWGLEKRLLRLQNCCVYSCNKTLFGWLFKLDQSLWESVRKARHAAVREGTSSGCCPVPLFIFGPWDCVAWPVMPAWVQIWAERAVPCTFQGSACGTRQMQARAHRQWFGSNQALSGCCREFHLSPFLGAPVASQVLQQGELSQLLLDPLQRKWNSCWGTLGA